jgi:hypothetical protein
MNGELTSASSAILGAFVGALASLTSTWIGERSRNRREILQREIAKRETAYSDFIERASKVYVASATHRIVDDEAEVERVVPLYSVASRIRLFASDTVITEVEKVIDQVLRQYGDDNVSAEQLRISVIEKRDDPLESFSVICRHELQDMQKWM